MALQIQSGCKVAFAERRRNAECGKKKKYFLNTLALDSQVKVLFLKDGAPKAGGDRTR